MTQPDHPSNDYLIIRSSFSAHRIAQSAKYNAHVCFGFFSFKIICFSNSFRASYGKMNGALENGAIFALGRCRDLDLTSFSGLSHRISDAPENPYYPDDNPDISLSSVSPFFAYIFPLHWIRNSVPFFSSPWKSWFDSRRWKMRRKRTNHSCQRSRMLNDFGAPHVCPWCRPAHLKSMIIRRIISLLGPWTGLTI